LGWRAPAAARTSTPPAPTVAPRSNPTSEVKSDQQPRVTPRAAGSAPQSGRAVFGIDAKNYAVQNPLRSGQANEARSDGAGVARQPTSTAPLPGTDARPPAVPQSRTPSSATSRNAADSNSSERGTARSATAPGRSTSAGPVQTARIEQPKPQSWWQKVNPFKASQSAPGATGGTAPRSSFAPASADATRRAFESQGRRATKDSSSREVKNEWGFGKRLAKAPTTRAAARTESADDLRRGSDTGRVESVEGQP
jgi:hypothetical protein